ncbi:MAG TPA: hypothetical protein VFT77_03715, partial [Reyranella sp.]|nr:hypothetical protein [Reyranella sp.]
MAFQDRLSAGGAKLTRSNSKAATPLQGPCLPALPSQQSSSITNPGGNAMKVGIAMNMLYEQGRPDVAVV